MNGILGNSWLKWFRHRNPQLVLRKPQPLNSYRARALCPSNLKRFHTNLSSLYIQRHYQATCIRNIDEKGVQANKNGHTRVFVLKRIKNINIVVPYNEKEHITILIAISANRDSIPNYYIFKGTKTRERYIS